jgi:hypothetical protein
MSVVAANSMRSKQRSCTRPLGLEANQCPPVPVTANIDGKVFIPTTYRLRDALQWLAAQRAAEAWRDVAAAPIGLCSCSLNSDAGTCSIKRRPRPRRRRSRRSRTTRGKSADPGDGPPSSPSHHRGPTRSTSGVNEGVCP